MVEVHGDLYSPPGRRLEVEPVAVVRTRRELVLLVVLAVVELEGPGVRAQLVGLEPVATAAVLATTRLADLAARAIRVGLARRDALVVHALPVQRVSLLALLVVIAARPALVRGAAEHVVVDAGVRVVPTTEHAPPAVGAEQRFGAVAVVVARRQLAFTGAQVAGGPARAATLPAAAATEALLVAVVVCVCAILVGVTAVLARVRVET